MRKSPSSCLSALRAELKSLRALDARTQAQISGDLAGPRLSAAQVSFLTEGVFFAAFRAYEQFVRNVFLLYCCGSQASGRRKVKSFLVPRSIEHAESLLKASRPFLDWASPDELIRRSESCLKDGYPIRGVLQGNLDALRAMKVIRNHIAHLSGESLQQFRKQLRAHFGSIPLRVPPPGSFLLLSPPHDSSTYYLSYYIDVIDSVAGEVV